MRPEHDFFIPAASNRERKLRPRFRHGPATVGHAMVEHSPTPGRFFSDACREIPRSGAMGSRGAWLSSPTRTAHRRRGQTLHGHNCDRTRICQSVRQSFRFLRAIVKPPDAYESATFNPNLGLRIFVSGSNAWLASRLGGVGRSLSSGSSRPVQPTHCTSDAGRGARRPCAGGAFVWRAALGLENASPARGASRNRSSMPAAVSSRTSSPHGTVNEPAGALRASRSTHFDENPHRLHRNGQASRSTGTACHTRGTADIPRVATP